MKESWYCVGYMAYHSVASSWYFSNSAKRPLNDAGLFRRVVKTVQQSVHMDAACAWSFVANQYMKDFMTLC